MASKYIIVLLVLTIVGFITLGLKRLLLLRRGFHPERKPVNWIMIGLLALLTVCLASCSKKSEDPADTATDQREQQSVVVTRIDGKTTDVHRVIDGKGNVTATVTTSVKNDKGEIVTEEKTIKGTRAEVDAQIKALSKKE